MNPETVDLLKQLLRKMEQNDFSTSDEDEALRQAIEYLEIS